jgi:poly(3-hydroxybutyrate) depolymerase
MIPARVASGLDGARAAEHAQSDRPSGRTILKYILASYLLMACGSAEDIDASDPLETPIELASTEQKLLSGCADAPWMIGAPPYHGRDQRCTLTFQGRVREYFVHVPPVERPGMAVVMEMHGGGGPAIAPGTQILSGWEQIADTEALAGRQSFYVVWPTGRGPATVWPFYLPDWWTCDYKTTSCPPPGGSNERDFLVAVINNVKLRANVDANRIYATGLSSGGAMAQILACDHSDKFAAVAPLAAGILSQAQEPVYNYDLRARCNPVRKVPQFYAHATQDTVVPYSEGVTSRGFWLSKLGCSSTVASFVNHEYDLTDGLNDPSVCNRYNCQANTKFEFCQLDASQNRDGFGGHVIWYGDDLEQPSILPEVGGGPHRLARLAWDFMRQYTLTNSGY